MNICLIPARGGSKRILGKNIKEFNGKPIIAYSIEAAIKSGCFDRIIVSTDDKEIAEFANHFGAETPFIRPAELANDFIGTIPVTKHAIQWLKENKCTPDYVCCLYATVPFITANLISESFNKIFKSKFEFIFAVTNYPAPIKRAIKINNQDRVEMINPDHYNTRTQDFEEFYFDAGQLCWGKSYSWEREESVIGPNTSTIILPSYLVNDIDTEEDWRKAEIMYRVLKSDGIL